MTPKETEYCRIFVAKWRKTLSGGIAGMMLRVKFGKLTQEKRRDQLRSYIFEAEELSDEKGATQEMRQYIFDEASGLIAELLDAKRPA